MTTKQIEKLKKQLLWEELRRRRKKPRYQRLLLVGALALLAAVAGFCWYRANLDAMLEQRFQKGLVLRAGGDFAGAAKLFRELQAEHPQAVRAPEALLQAAELQHLKLGHDQEALRDYLSLERDYPGSTQAVVARRQVAALYKERLDDQARAIAAYQRLLEEGGEHADRLQYEVADSYFRLNNFEQARIEFENLLNAYPESPLAAEVQFRIAVTYALEGAAEKAMAAYREVTVRWPHSSYAAEARFGLATVLEDRERLREALTILEGLQGVYPNREALAQRMDRLQRRIDNKPSGK